MSKPTPADAGRACQTCGATKTPVWRTGPTGPKTMCNRCGIKWMRRNPSAAGASRKRAESPSMSPKSDNSETSSPELPTSPKKRRKRNIPKDVANYLLEDEEEEVEGISGGEQEEIDENEFIEMDDEEDSNDLPPISLVTRSPRSTPSATPNATPEILDSPSRKRIRPTRILSKESGFLFSSSSESLGKLVEAESARKLERKSSSYADVNSSEDNNSVEFTFHASSLEDRPSSTNAHNAENGDAYSNYVIVTNRNVYTPPPPVAASAFQSIALSDSKLLEKDMQKLQVDVPKKCVGAQIVGTSIGSYLDLSTQTDVTANSLMNLPATLQHLTLSKCKHLTDADLLSLPPQIRSLDLSHCVHITDEAIRHLPIDLQHLNLRNCLNITDEGLRHLPVTLLSLNVGNCSRITDEGLVGLPPLLTRLELDGCKITDEGLRSLPVALSHLNIASCDRITDAGLDLLPPHLTHLDLGSTGVTCCEPLKKFSFLKHLDLTQCKISDQTVENLPSSVEWLNLFRCSGVSDGALNADRLRSSQNDVKTHLFSANLKIYV